MKITLILLFFVSVKSQKEEVVQIVTSSGGEKKGRRYVYEFVDVLPEFPGGMQAMYDFLGSEVVYPKEARINEIEGKVYVKFIVLKSGKIGDVKIVKGTYNLLNEEAIRAVKAMPKWTPGEQRGKKVNTWFTLPINFKIGTSEK